LEEWIIEKSKQTEKKGDYTTDLTAQRKSATFVLGERHGKQSIEGTWEGSQGRRYVARAVGSVPG
jgi:hypothetical protein